MSSKFQLISKTTTSFIKYKGDAVRLTLNPPAKVDEVIVALKDNENLKRRITTFRDSQGNIIELVHNQFVSLNRNAAVELVITIEAFGPEHKEEILAALNDGGYRPIEKKTKAIF